MGLIVWSRHDLEQAQVVVVFWRIRQMIGRSGNYGGV